MVVIPYDGEAVVQSAEPVVALRYALECPAIPAVIAYERAEAHDFARHGWFAIASTEVGDDLPRDVSAVVYAVDRECAAYECLHTAARAP